MKAPAPILIEPLEARIAPAGIANIDVTVLDGTSGFKLGGINAAVGASVSGAGDVNGDGFADVIVSAPGANGEAFESGASYVLFGKASGFTPNFDLTTLNGINGFKISGIAAYDRTGISVSGAGDVNGDGFADLIVGSRPEDSDFARAGAAYVIFGRASGFGANIDLSALNGADGFSIGGASVPDRFGTAVSGAGDVNGDGFADIIVGAYRTETGDAFAGASYVIFGKATGFAANFDISTLDGINGFKVTGVAKDLLGYAVSEAGDVNGDGFDDLLIGAHGASPHGKGSGAAYVIFGKASGFTANFDPSTLNGTNGFKINGTVAAEAAGLSVSSAGDVNGDGFADLLLGTIHQSPTGRGLGAAYVVFGKAGFTARLNLSAINGTNGFQIGGGASNLMVGRSVSGAGDMNGDGFDDVIVNAIHYTSDTAYFSTSYVVFGKAAGIPSNVNLTKLAKASGFQIGAPSLLKQYLFAVSGAGDVNGDGVSDLILGGVPTDNTGPDVTYIVFGKAASNTYTFRDADGDRVKIVASQGVIDPHGLAFTSSGMGRQLDLLDLTGNTIAAGANLTIKAIPRVVNGVTFGNGQVNIGKIDASGVNLGTVTIAGDLTEFHAGDGSDVGVQTLNVTSLGKNAALFPTLTPGLDVAGRLGQLTVSRNVTGFAIGIGAGDAHGVGLVQIGGSLTNSTLGVGAKIGKLTVGGSIVDSTVRAPGALLPASTTAAVAIGTLSVNGSVVRSSILAGYDTAGSAVNGDAGIGTVTIKGNFVASNLVAGVADATLDGFGQKDSIIPDSSDAILATIARLVIKGTATGSAAIGDFFGITAAFFGAAKVHGSILALTNEPTSYFPLDPVNKDLRLAVV